ncbi:MAG: hypothetical protein PUH11_05550 [Bacilli bacterium]|nr:hypothetical protein [Bacilli bacterium]
MTFKEKNKSAIILDDLFRKMNRQYANDIEKVKQGKLKMDEVRWSTSTGCTSLHKAVMF